MTVSLVDRYLSQRIVTRKTLQLLGIACMVIAARFSENEVITIREAAWLTDNTYTYEKVVRTMGKALCAAHGRLRVSTHLDFLRLFISLAGVDPHTEELMHFVSELVLLHMTVANTSPVHVAAAVFYLTKFSTKSIPENCWPDRLQQWTNLSVQDIAAAVLDIQERCFQIPAVKDHRGVELQAVNERYERRTGKSVKDFVPPSTIDLQQGLALRCNLDLAHTHTLYATAPNSATVVDVPMTDAGDTATREATARTPSPELTMEIDGDIAATSLQDSLSGTTSDTSVAFTGPAPLSNMTNVEAERTDGSKRNSSATTPMTLQDFVPPPF